MNKTIHFKAANCESAANDVESRNIWTTFTTINGRYFYIRLKAKMETYHDLATIPEELQQSEIKMVYGRKGAVGFPNMITVVQCYEIRKIAGKVVCQHHRVERRRTHLPYTKSGILLFINKNFGCKFDKLSISFDKEDQYEPPHSLL